MKLRNLMVRLFLCISIGMSSVNCKAEMTTITMINDKISDEQSADYPAVQSSTYNYGRHNYSVWARPVYSGLNETPNGYECFMGTYIEQYSKDFEFLDRKYIDSELPIFGGFYYGKNHNYLIQGQSNENEDDSKEVIRIIKYTKDWERLNSVSLYGINTTVPFEAGTVNCIEGQGRLYIRTCHKMYKISDGLNHQSSMSFILDEESMEVTDIAYEVENKGGCVSHSFNQLLMFDDQDLISVDHCDANPRSIILQKYKGISDQFPKYNTFLGQMSNSVSSDLLSFRGQTGDNITNASLGGAVVTDSSYLVAGNYLRNEADEQRSIWLSIQPKDDLSSNKLIYLTDGQGDIVQTPYILKVKNDLFVILWNSYNKETEETIEHLNGCNIDKGYHLNYVFIDQDGNRLTDNGYIESGALLSDCKPIVVGNKLVWFSYDQSAPIFYEFNIDTKTVKRTATIADAIVKYMYDDEPYCGLQYIDSNGYCITNEMRDIDGKTYFFNKYGYTESSLFKWKGKYYIPQTDYSIIKNAFITEDSVPEEFHWEYEFPYYATQDGSLKTSGHYIHENVKYYFGKDGEVTDSYLLTNKKSIFKYKKNADDNCKSIDAKNFKIPKKVTVKKGKKLYVCNASIMMLFGTNGDVDFGEKTIKKKYDSYDLDYIVYHTKGKYKAYAYLNKNGKSHKCSVTVVVK